MALDKQHPAAAPFLVGQVAFFAMATAPAGFLKCSGQAVSRSTYAALFSALGVLYGAGDGSTTFNLPDLRGEFVRCFDDGKGTDAGRSLGSSQADELKSHSHSTTGISLSGMAGSNVTVSNASQNTGSTGGTETRPRNVALLACIFTGVQ